ncbi:hypothetical protein BH23BAC3_BH23BAC3_29430 [soil metagenome]
MRGTMTKNLFSLDFFIEEKRLKFRTRKNSEHSKGDIFAFIYYFGLRVCESGVQTKYHTLRVPLKK